MSVRESGVVRKSDGRSKQASGVRSLCPGTPWGTQEQERVYRRNGIAHDRAMAIEVSLERVEGEDASVMCCSLCKEEFHTAPVGPRKWMWQFGEHVKTEHPGAVIKPGLASMFARAKKD